MEQKLIHHSQDLLSELDVRLDTIKKAPFQGEICTVFKADSGVHGSLVIKTALKGLQISEEGQKEIQQNKDGYKCIPSSFRPEIIASDKENTFLVMQNVGRPLRDLLWENQHSLQSCTVLVDGFLLNLGQLFSDTKTHDLEARDIFLDQLQKMGRFFLQADLFPANLRSGFDFMVNHIKQNDTGVVSIATLDFTQGNLLIDTRKLPQTLKIIDPKQPRMVREKPTFLGISEVDMGMFFTTLNLNAPGIVQGLGIDEKLKSIGRGLRGDTRISDLSFDLGKMFGCILIASFPNTIERVETYLRSVGANCDEDIQGLVVRERERHVDMAVNILENMEDQI